jgi:acyl-ACP thioesterase
VHVRPWPVRTSDFDLLGHVNNAAYWFAVEDELARVAPARASVSAELEHRAAIEARRRVELRSMVDGDVLSVWLTAHGEARSAAQLRASA